MTRYVRMGALRECARPFLVPFQLRRDDCPCLAILSGLFAGRRLSGDNDEKKLACGCVVDIRTACVAGTRAKCGNGRCDGHRRQ
jgi:hypothetical protein